MIRHKASALILNIRIVIILVVTMAFMIADVRFNSLSGFRYYLESALYPVIVFADSPRQATREVSTQLKSRSLLIAENERLSNENYMQRADLLRLQALEMENAAMRRLLNSPVQQQSQRLFAEVIDVDSDPSLQRILVNRGLSSGVYQGMPVVSDRGLVGQVISVSRYFSRVLLLTDPSSSVPVIDARNEVRAIASGDGVHDELTISNVPRSTDIKEGDLLVTSGLGGVYPEGYPVAIVTSVGFAESQPFASVRAKPLEDFDRIRYVLMLWYRNQEHESELKLHKPKMQTDSKLILRQERIKHLIEAMTDSSYQQVKPETKAKDR